MNARRPNPLLLVVLTVAATAVVAACTGGSGPLGTVPALSGSRRAVRRPGQPGRHAGAVRRRELRAVGRANRSGRVGIDPAMDPPRPSVESRRRDDDRPGLLLARRRPGSARPRRRRSARCPARRPSPRPPSTPSSPGRSPLETGQGDHDRAPGRHAAPRPHDRRRRRDGQPVERVRLGRRRRRGADPHSGQVVYTLTQFPSVKSVVLQVEGVDPAKRPRAGGLRLAPAGHLGRSSRRGTPRSATRPTSPAPRTSSRRRSGSRSSTRPARSSPTTRSMATCGSGCRGTFDTSVAYSVSRGQYGTLRVYNPSAKDGSPESIRDYRVWLTPKG